MSPRSPAVEIRLENLSAGYGDHAVLSRINAVLPAARTTVILGGSGCGKSTLLRHIVGLARPLHGRILLNDEDMFALPQPDFHRARRRMGMLFQDGALLGALTLAENVALPLTEHTRLSAGRIREEALRALALVGLEEFADYYPNQLSGGMRKRSGLARAIITEPPILLCDEPTSGLDPVTAAQMDQLLLDMRESFPHMTLVVVSHDLASLARIADHVLVLHEGGVAFSGTYAALRETNVPYLRRFLERQSGGSGGMRGTSLAPESRKALDAWLAS